MLCLWDLHSPNEQEYHLTLFWIVLFCFFEDWVFGMPWLGPLDRRSLTTLHYCMEHEMSVLPCDMGTQAHLFSHLLSLSQALVFPTYGKRHLPHLNPRLFP